MGKRTGVKKQHRSPTLPPLVVDATEVGAAGGCLTLRCSPNHPAAPTLIALPYWAAANLPQRLQELARVAENRYWPLMAQWRSDDPRQAPDDVERALARATQRHVRGQDWRAALAAVADGNPQVFQHEGYVALHVRPPYSRKPALLVFDPLQLRRLAASFDSAVSRAHAQCQDDPQEEDAQRATSMLDRLADAPWPPPGQFDPTADEAEQVMQSLHEDYLARVPYQRAAAPTTAAPAADTAWTPLLHPCGCTVDWGWDGHEAPPDLFIPFCLRSYTAPCPWHSDSIAKPPAGGVAILVLCASSGARFWARKADRARLALGAELTRQLAELTSTVIEADPDVFTATLPAAWCRSVTAMGDDPLRAYLEQRLVDIILNRGADTLASLTALSAASEAHPSAAPPAIDCETCTTARALGGIICVCGHDWSCHPGPAGRGEPCSHCPCPDMHMAE